MDTDSPMRTQGGINFEMDLRWTPTVGDLAWFTKSMVHVTIVEIPSTRVGYFDVRKECGKEMVVPRAGIIPRDAFIPDPT